jgi:hypothetical protein
MNFPSVMPTAAELLQHMETLDTLRSRMSTLILSDLTVNDDLFRAFQKLHADYAKTLAAEKGGRR